MVILDMKNKRVTNITRDRNEVNARRKMYINNTI